MEQFEFINKGLFFPKQAILVIGDLHIGYEYQLQQSGVLLPEQQVKETIKNIEEILDILKKKKQIPKKIVFLGDIKHAFSFEPEERNQFREIMNFLKKTFDEKDIILIRGNHDTMDYSYGNMVDYHITDDKEIAFLHGHEPFPEIYDKDIKIVVTGHLHPSIVISEEKGVKQETYKCFIAGKSKNKIFIVVPSFLEFYEGTPVNYYREDFIESFSVIPRKDILKFKISVIGDDKTYDFGKIEDL